MSEWLPLPTHEGYWWEFDKRDLSSTIINVFMDDGTANRLYDNDEEEIMWERVGISYYPVSPPPSEEMPKRFLWSGGEKPLFGIRFADGGGICQELGGVGSSWIEFNAGEIEWID